MPNNNIGVDLVKLKFDRQVGRDYIGMMITLSYNPNSRMAHLADEVKLCWMICLSVIILFNSMISSQLFMLAGLIVLALYGDVKLSQLLAYIKIFIPVMMIIFLFHLFYFKGETLFTLWFLTASKTGLHSGTFNALRFFNFLIVTYCFLNWSSPLNLAVKLATFFGLLRNRFNQELALVFFIALRFMPVLIRERSTLILAMRARGASVSGGMLSRIKLNIRLLLPLLSRALGQTDDVAAALALKGSGGNYFVPEKFKPGFVDILLIITGLALTVAVLLYE